MRRWLIVTILVVLPVAAFSNEMRTKISRTYEANQIFILNSNGGYDAATRKPLEVQWVTAIVEDGHGAQEIKEQQYIIPK